jgi:hypothetical protein
MQLRSMVKALRVAAGAALLVAGLSAQAQAAPIVYVSPVSQTINISNNPFFVVDIFVKDVDEALGGFGFSLTWDASIVVLGLIDWDPDGNWTNASVLPLPHPSSLDLSLSGDPAGANLAGTDPFRLATLFFQGIDVGNSKLDLTFAALSDDAQEPTDIPGVTSQDGLVCVVRAGLEGPEEPVLNDPNCVPNVPEPAMLSLLAAGLVTVAARRRAAKRG